MFCQSCGKDRPDANAPCPHCGAGAQRTPPAGQAPAEPSRVGLVIDEKYRLDGMIGVGGMATVYRATRLLIGDTVAVKILHAAQMADPQSAERFRREAQAAARLKHPNAVTIYDFGVSNDGLIFLVMELVHGQSLRAMIKEQGPFTPTAAAGILTQASAALDEAHRQNIVHRDIKPDNILVDVSSGTVRVKVLDFGIARMRDIAAANLTQTGSVMGTPHYMSPEQCLGEELDQRSDIYSLGIVLFEMLTGIVPFNSPTPTAVIIQHVNQAPPPLPVINISIPESVDAVVRHALAKRRDDRPRSAGALAEELNAAVSGGAGTPTPPANAMFASPASSSVPTMQMAPPAWTNAPAQPPPITARPTDRPAKRGPPWTWIGVAAAVVVLAAAGAFAMLHKSGGAEPEHVAATTAGGSPVVAGAAATSAPSPTPPPPAANPAPPPPSAGPAQSAARSAGSSSLAIQSASGATVLVDNAPIGTTDGQGFLKRDGLAAGTHFVKIHKEGYGDEQRTVSLPPGQAQALNLVLAPLPGKLTISPSIPDADVVVAGRSYHGQVSDLQLAAGQYPVTVSKTGFKSDTRTVTVAPGRVQNVDVTLQPLSSQEQLGSIEKKYQAKDFDGVISDGRGLLATQPQNSKLNLMIGSALYSKGSIAASTSYFSTAIDLGDTVKLQGKHHHGGLGGGDFLNGILSFSKGGFAWHETDGTGDDFSVAASKIYSIKTQPENTAQVSIQVGIAKGDKEDKKRYDWRPAWTQITVTNPGQPIPIKSVTCAGAICDQWMNLIADLARKLKQ